jgi:hypothetical protein
MNPQQEFESILETAFRDEAARMDVDEEAAAARLSREVAGSDRAHRRSRVLAVVAAAALVVAVVLVGRFVDVTGRSDSGVVPAREDPPAIRGPYLYDLDSGAATPLPPAVLPDDIDTLFSLKVSPDGQWIAYTACTWPTDADWGCSGAEGAVMRRDGTERVALPITEDQSVADVVWSPDGRSLAYQLIDPRLPGQKGEEFGVGELYVYDRPTGRSARVTDITLEKSDWWVLLYSFTADGRSLLYDLPGGSGPNDPWDVWSVPVTGGTAHRVIRDARAPEALRDASGIAYVVPIRGSWAGSAIRLVDSAGDDRELVAAEVAIDGVQSAPGGQRLAYEDRGTTSVVDVRSGTVEKIADQGMYGWADDHTLILAGTP